VRVRLTKKLANRIDGIDVSPHSVGDIVDFPPEEARLLLAEEWATDRERRRRQVRDVAMDRRRKPTVRLRSDDDGGNQPG
jgi:hypothetical protein